MTTKAEARMTDLEMEQVAGGADYYSADVYRRNDITLVDGGATCYFAGREVSESEAAAIVFYKSQFPPSKVKKLLAGDFDDFIHTVTSYRDSQYTEFELHYKKNSGIGK